MKKSAIYKLVSVVLIVVVGISIFNYFKYKKPNIVHPYSQEYVVGTGNIKGDVDTKKYLDIDKRLEVGARADGFAVFKDPHAAFDVIIEKYQEGIKAVQKQYKANELTRTDYKLYKVYGWQVFDEYGKEAQSQARFLSGFFDIYEMSFETD